ncbi:hypothetical protein [Paenibacillus silviterrae]|nr:hypothetical protein [Paenibacillus chinjuensis]
MRFHYYEDGGLIAYVLGIWWQRGDAEGVTEAVCQFWPAMGLIAGT